MAIINTRFAKNTYRLYPMGGNCSLVVNNLDYRVDAVPNGDGTYRVDVNVYVRRGRSSYSRRVAMRVKPEGKTGRRVIASAIFPLTRRHEP